ncbi:MAG: 5-(carboxyamino)imidazole ribonucleotide synthase [Chloroflexota bacterium]
MKKDILHSKTALPIIGIFGNGQLGRMLSMEARRMGIHSIVFGPGAASPTGEIATEIVDAPYSDLDRVREFAKSVDVITYEFENIPLPTAMAAAELTPVFPQPSLLAIAQNRLREKSFLSQIGLPVTLFRPVNSPEELAKACQTIGYPAVLKTAESGYDGKGQAKLYVEEDQGGAWKAVGEKPSVLEEWIEFKQEISVVGARDKWGGFESFGPIENQHTNHILDLSIWPALCSEQTAKRAVEAVKQVMDHLEIIGVLCVEFFELENGDLILNEIAPRPHNSGHLTIEGFATNQFEQQLRTIIGLPVGKPVPRSAVCVMGNLLGDLWPLETGGDPQWDKILENPMLKLHLYGKKAARPGRKMGHITLTGSERQGCIEAIREARLRLSELKFLS